MNIVKKIIYVIILLVLVGVFAVISVMYFFDPNKIKPLLIEKVQKETDFKLTINGHLAWTFYPILGIKAKQLILTPRDNKSGIMTADNVNLHADLIKLLKTKNKFDGNISIEKFKLANVYAENISAQLHLENKIFIINNIKAKFYQGELTGQIIGQDLFTMPYWQWRLGIYHFQVTPLLYDLHGGKSALLISGKGNITLQAEAHGNNQQELLSQLKGNGHFSLDDGFVYGIDINHLLDSANAIFNKEAPPLSINSNQTAFDSLSASISIENGMAKTDNLVLNAPRFSVKAEGSIELNSSAIQFALQARPILPNATIHWDIPILITGDLDRPKIRLDMIEIKERFYKEKINQIKDKALDKIKKYIPGKTGDYLQNLLGS